MTGYERTIAGTRDSTNSEVRKQASCNALLRCIPHKFGLVEAVSIAATNV
jgi:hypothetical protein